MQSQALPGERAFDWAYNKVMGSNPARPTHLGRSIQEGLDASIFSPAATGRSLMKKNWLGALGYGLSAGYIALGFKQGYEQGGVWGALKESGSRAAFEFGTATAFHFAGAPLLKAGAVGGAFAAGWGIGRQMVNPNAWKSMFEEEGAAHRIKHAKLELATPVLDNFGNVNTMRQRSIQAIQQSRLNGRYALGNEGALMYQPYFR